MALAARKLLTYLDYVAIEESSTEKHEFEGGELFAMSGGTPRHAELQGALIGLLFGALHGRRCKPYGPDLRLYFSDRDESAYADAVVVCGPVVTDAHDPHGATNPTAVFEVLSPTTEAYDRGRKFAKYRRLLSLQEYVLVAQESALVEVFHREAAGAWTLRTYGPGTRVELASVNVSFAVDELYAGVFEDAAS